MLRAALGQVVYPQLLVSRSQLSLAGGLLKALRAYDQQVPGPGQSGIGRIEV